MGHPGVMLDLGIALAAALVGGLLARALKMPVLVGYLIAGVVVGPHTPLVFAKPEPVNQVAELGVALLMFVVGVHFSITDLLAVWRTAVIGGTLQIVATALMGMGAGLLLGMSLYASLFLGCALALSSTAVMMKVLEERGEMGTSHGRVMLGILVVQDFSLVVMAILLPAAALLSSGSSGAWPTVGMAILKALLFLGVTVVLAERAVPAILNAVVRTRSRELFLLAVMCLCLAAGVGATYAGLGIELGAFIAGLVISETEHADEALAQIRPLRDVFASLFFVSLGMLLDPRFLASHIGAIALILVVIAIGKPLLTTLAVIATGWDGRTALFTGLGLAQIGEFSFVLATIGASRSLVPPDLSNLIVSSALLSLLFAPFLFRAADPVHSALGRTPLSRIVDRRAGSRPAYSSDQKRTP